MYNFNAFCKSMQCPDYVEQYLPVGKCTMCSKVGFSLNITRYPHQTCNFKKEIRAAAEDAKAKDKIWRKLKRTDKPGTPNKRGESNRLQRTIMVLSREHNI